MATGTHGGFDPESALTVMRESRRNPPAKLGQAYVRAVEIVDRAVEQARHLWKDPAEREAAGFGALTAASTFVSAAVDGGDAMMLNLVGLFGQALVDDARAELRAVKP